MEFDNGRIKDSQSWHYGNQEAEPGSDEAAATLERTGSRCRLIAAAPH
jgi:hypothetical protein